MFLFLLIEFPISKVDNELPFNGTPPREDNVVPIQVLWKMCRFILKIILEYVLIKNMKRIKNTITGIVINR